MTALSRLPVLTRAATLFSVPLLLASSLWLDGTAVTILAAAAILLLGIPHGGFDRMVARSLWSRLPAGLPGDALFAAAYLGIAALMLLLWHWSALAGLSIFLAVSLLHFGLGDRDAGPDWLQALQTLAHGGMIVILIPLAHAGPVTGIFSSLSDPQTAVTVMGVLRAAALPWGLAVLLYGFFAIRRSRCHSRLIELGALSIALTLLPPLLGFLLYFGALHGPRHMASALAGLRRQGLPMRAIAIEMTWISLATYAAFVMAALLVPADGLEDGVLRTVFIGLASLTLPHMLLTDLPKHGWVGARVTGRRIRSAMP